MKVLVTRTDRLGDVMVSQPALTYLKRVRPDWQVHAMVAPEALPLVENDPDLDGVWTWSVVDGICDLRALEADLREAGFDAVVLLQYRRELAALLRRAGIRRRYGPRSKLSSWLLLNRGTWQARSQRDGHEGDYGLDLVCRVAGMRKGGGTTPRLYLSEGQRAVAAKFRAEQGAGAKVVAFVHPGSGGSALDWEPRSFVRVANALAERPGWRVFVTGSGADQALLAPVKHELAPAVQDLQDAYDLRDFMGVLAAGDLFVGPSTGPLHMAAALDLAVVGLFPPVRTMAPERWGPRGPWACSLVPEVVCPARRTCTKARCPFHNCMDRIAEEDVITTALAAVARREVLEEEP